LKYLSGYRYIFSLVLFSLVILPKNAFACSICDKYLIHEYYYPLGKLCALSSAWVLLLHFHGKSLYSKICENEEELDPKKFPPNIPGLRLYFIGLALYLFLVILFSVFSYPCSVFSFLIIAVYYSSIIFILPYRAPPIIGGLSIKLCRFNKVYWSIVAFIVIHFLVQGTSIDGIIKKAQENETYDDIRIVSRLINKGEKVADPLAKKVDMYKDSSFDQEKVSLCVFVLGKVGGDKAKACLASLLEYEKRYAHDDYIKSNNDYLFILLYAYVECCGQDAVPQLVDLYGKTKPRDAIFREYIVNALISIGGMQLVEESLPSHIDEIKKKFNNVPTNMNQAQRREYLYKPVVKAYKDYKWQELSRELDERQGK
jgi:hypothetical protein